MKIGSYCPWGKIQSMGVIVPKGIVWVSTSGHGGYKVYKKLNNQIPEYMRKKDGWYEEDCEVPLVQISLPQFFKPEQLMHSKPSVANWFPDEYEKFYGVTLNPGESIKKDEREFKKKHENDWIVICAWNDSKEDVPRGMIGCIATKGGKRALYKETLPEKNFLVPEEEYGKRCRFGFVIDENKHQIWNR